MSKATKTRLASKKSQPGAEATFAGSEAAPAQRPRESWRDSVESIVVAFILALLIRGFDAEAFVIPTGSMAPTLMGRHKEITCPQCGAVYALNATDETRTPGARIVAGTCSNCRYRAEVDEAPTFNGDRILVMKFPYDLPWLPGAAKPKRWDVVVFHYPEQPEQNYIKRLVGLPGEELMIRSGDVWARPLGSDEPFVIRRKPSYKLRQMMIPVYDDRHRAAAMADLPEWQRWQARDGQGWEAAADRSSSFNGAADPGQTAWLDYRHLVADPYQWQALARGVTATPPRPSLIDDYYSYNTSQSDPRGLPVTEPHWVGDVSVGFELEVVSSSGTLVVEIIEGGVPHRAEIDLASGKATLRRGEASATVETPIRGAGSYRVAFANVDDALTLWVNGRAASGGLEFRTDPAEPLAPTEADLSPVRIGISGGEARVSDLVLTRDIHYTVNPSQSDYLAYGGVGRDSYEDIRALLQTPERFGELVELDDPAVYPIRPGRYMMLGDNSPRSRDSRAWGELDTEGGGYWDDHGHYWRTGPWADWDRAAHEVPEELITGRAFFIYWPHGVPFGPKLEVSQDFRIPFRPYFERMIPIR